MSNQKLMIMADGTKSANSGGGSNGSAEAVEFDVVPYDCPHRFLSASIRKKKGAMLLHYLPLRRCVATRVDKHDGILISSDGFEVTIS